MFLRTRRNERLKTQLRIADAITSFAGSMLFVYLHAAAFTVWMLFFESTPWPTLTMVVSLEAIFLSTFVMIGQNRQSAFQQAKAGHDFLEQELELKTNTELTRALSGHRHGRCVDTGHPDRILPDTRVDGRSGQGRAANRSASHNSRIAAKLFHVCTVNA